MSDSPTLCPHCQVTTAMLSDVTGLSFVPVRFSVNTYGPGAASGPPLLLTAKRCPRCGSMHFFCSDDTFANACLTMKETP